MSEMDEKAQELQEEATEAVETAVDELESAEPESAEVAKAIDAESKEPEAKAEATAEDAGTEGASEPASAQEGVKASTPSKNAKGIGDLVIVGIFSIILGVLLCLPQIMGSSESAGTRSYDLSGGVAATLGNIQIGENDITAYINDYRNYSGLTTDEEWGEWMASYGYTPEEIRSSTIDYFLNQELIAKAADEMGVEVSESQLEEQVAAIAEEYGGMESFKAMLESEGLTLESVYESISMSLLQEGLADKVAAETTAVDDEAVLEIMKLYYPEDVPENATSLEGLDPETVETVRGWLQDSMRDQAFSDWFEQYRADADITVNDMPEGLPYDIDMSAYEMTDDVVELMDGSGLVLEGDEEEVEVAAAD